jgi:hypothetical protein
MPLIDTSPPVLASPRLGGLTAPSLSNEAEPSSLTATARAFAPPSFNDRDRSRPLKGRLHVFRSFIMVNTFQFTRTTKLFLALSEPRAYPHGYVRSEQRSLRPKELPPSGLRQIWPVAVLLLSHSPLTGRLLRRALPQAKFDATNG